MGGWVCGCVWKGGQGGQGGSKREGERGRETHPARTARNAKKKPAYLSERTMKKVSHQKDRYQTRACSRKVIDEQTNQRTIPLLVNTTTNPNPKHQTHIPALLNPRCASLTYNHVRAHTARHNDLSTPRPRPYKSMCRAAFTHSFTHPLSLSLSLSHTHKHTQTPTQRPYKSMCRAALTPSLARSLAH